MIKTAKLRIIDDCYNANPTSVRASLDTLKNFGGRTVAILGDMKELGRDELRLHFDTGAYARQLGIGLVLAAGPLAQELAKGADGVWFSTVEELIADLGKYISDGDTVLVKASHSMHFERITEALKAL